MLPESASFSSSSGRPRPELDDVARHQQHAGRAEAALQPVLFGEGAAQHGHQRIGLEGFQRLDAAALGGDGKRDAAAHRLAVEQHGAGAADAMLAAQMGGGQVQPVAQEVGQRLARLDAGADRGAVDLKGDLWRIMRGRP
jgi:hypothetical protein